MTSCSQLCRACLSSNVSNHYILTQNVSTEIYFFCTSIEVTQDDLPKTLCDTCYELLLKFSEFKKTCLESQKTLLSTCDPKGETSTDEIKYDHHTENQDDEVPVNVKTEKDFADFNFELIKEEDVSDHYNDDLLEVADLNNSPVLNKSKSKLRRLNKVKKQKKPRIKLKIPKRHFAFACDICNKKFNYYERLEAHKLEHDGKVVQIHCLQCNKRFMTWNGLKRHNDSEHTIVSLDKLKCNVCGKVCKTQHTLKTHEKTHGERQIFVCDVCGKGFTSKFILKTHIDTHMENRERNFTCEQCGKKFFTHTVLISHMTKRHSGRRFICHVCSYPFTDKYNLAKHLLIHDGKKLFKCEICHKSYASRASLVEHKRIHSGERPYVCSYCPKSFLSKRRVEDHHKIHTGERPHKCTICSQGFTQRGTLKRHMKVHGT
ncbi:hypothetical protein ABMA28_007306 [Loxostege sticticalis]|uniref:Uncharacterized protein n=1 Tax=Loxostege sticticalis TaxID=481309 RepID=A0ABD0TQM2_LOXSC